VVGTIVPRRELQEAGVRAPAIVPVEGSAIATGRRAFSAILGAAPDTDGVFFSTDQLAVGGLLECQQRGIDVPGRIALAGLGDLEIGRELVPALTTVRVPAAQIGRRAGEIVLSRLRGEVASERVLDLGFSIVARHSTGP
jgi:LacI family transcriptional regulator, gluconate utilization system Gnt-I transcriptional repressor